MAQEPLSHSSASVKAQTGASPEGPAMTSAFRHGRTAGARFQWVFMKAAGERVAVRMRAMGQPWELGMFLWLPCVLFAVVAAADVHYRGSSLGDWEIFRSAARSALHGHSPYPAAV